MSKTNIVLIFLAIAVIMFAVFVIYNQNQSIQSLRKRSVSNIPNGNNGDGDTAEERKTRNTFNSVLQGLESNAMNNPFDYEALAQTLYANGVIAVREGQQMTMEYNPKRVVVRETQKQCITTPCFNIFEIVSIG